MAMPMQFDARMVRDAQKWGRWTWKRRLLKKMMDPEGARQMQAAHAAASMFAAAQPRRDSALWSASSFLSRGR